MVWWIDRWPAAGWGLVMKEDWMNIVAHGVIVYAAIPLRDSINGEQRSPRPNTRTDK